MFVNLFIFLSGILSLVFVRSHYLLSLLSLEFMVISIFLFSINFFSFYLHDYYFSVMFLVLGVCDGVLGLSLLVYLIRSVSNDYVDLLILC
uniref:NADH-ubiquinone oxidoreductase chain 4L n=1 Tax=Magadhaideus sp. n. SX-2018 TaxID=2220057 RepID=A0A451GIR0_9HEMI|nr:NADH dehydrogenase subunit 4L [Magadhaideus sp. n. SX-2018]